VTVAPSQNGLSVVAFAPYAGLIEHSRLEHAILSRIALSGARVDLLSCRGALPTPCTTMDGTLGVDRVPGRRAASATCRFCIEAGSLFSTSSRLNRVFIEDLIDEQVLADCHRLATEITPRNWQELVLDGIPVGKHAAYVSLIRAKATSTSDLERVWDRYVADLEASLITLRATQALLSRSRYSAAVTFGGLYGPERVFHRVTSEAAIPLVVLEGSILNQERHSVVHAFTSDAKYAHPVFDPEWATHRQIPLDRSTAERIRVHHEALLDSANPLVYSTDRNKEMTASEVRGRFGIPEDAPVLLVLISSPDEEVSREYTVGPDPAPGQDSVGLQASAVERIIRFAQQNPSVHVVIRLHPRLFGDHRTSAASPALDYYSRLASGAPINVHVNSPDQNLSLYDIALIADAGVVHQSTAGLELLALGLPVVASGPGLIAYPLDLVYLATDSNGLDFHQVLLTALDAPPDLSRTRDAYRWWGFVSNFNRMPTVSEKAHTSEAPALEAPSVSTNMKLRKFLTRTTRRLLPTPLRQQVALRIRHRKLSQIAQDLAAPQLQQLSESVDLPGTFWSVASGTNVITNRTPMTVQEEDRFLRHQMNRMATLLHIDDQSPGKLGKFVKSLRMEEGAML
jgi:hypothetical protein